jgi:predicted dehydrogenase
VNGVNRRLSRRQFLQDSVLRAGMTAVLAAGESAVPVLAQPQPRRQASPNERIQIAVIGVRGRGMDHLNGYLNLPEAEVVAICDVDPSVTGKAVKAVEAKGGKVQVYQDIRKLLENKDIDAVSMALPIHWHALASIWAMQAGKDVYVEKPVSHNVSEGRRMIEAAQRYGRVCQAGTQSRSAQATREAMAYIHSGKLGKVELARGLCYKRRASIGMKPDGPVPDGVDYDIWLGPAPKRPFNPNRFHYNWHWMWDYGTGDLGNQGIHQMDIARWALNKHEMPKSVMAVGGRFGYEDQGETPNTLLAFYDYGDADLIFEVRGLPTQGEKEVTIGDIVYGSEGYLVVTSNYGAAAVFDKDGKPVTSFKGGGSHFRNFLEAVRSRKMSDLHAPITEGHLSSALCHLGNASYLLGEQVPFSDKTKRFGDDKEAYATFGRFEEHLTANGVALADARYHLGRKLTLDVKKENFGSDKAANALLTREYRAPFVVPSHIA